MVLCLILRMNIHSRKGATNNVIKWTHTPKPNKSPINRIKRLFPLCSHRSMSHTVSEQKSMAML